jgi:hypothetical protein
VQRRRSSPSSRRGRLSRRSSFRIEWRAACRPPRGRGPALEFRDPRFGLCNRRLPQFSGMRTRCPGSAGSVRCASRDHRSSFASDCPGYLRRAITVCAAPRGALCEASEEVN